MFPLVAPLNHLIICAAPNMNFFAPNKNFFAPNTNVFAPNINFLSTAIMRDPEPDPYSEIGSSKAWKT